MATEPVGSQPTKGPDGSWVAMRPLRVTFYRRGAKVTGFDYDGPTGGGKRGKVGKQSDASLRRLAWSLDNAPAPWAAWSLLTFRTWPKRPKDALERFTRAVRTTFPGCAYAWYMEVTKKRKVHFHFLWPKPWLDATFEHGQNYESVVGTGDGARYVLRGALDDFVARHWVSAVGDKDCRFERFQFGGTSEFVRDSSRLAWYPAAEANKREQKCLPRGVDHLGLWWYISPGQRPKPVGSASVTEWPLEHPAALLYDASVLGDVEWTDLDGFGVA